MNIVVDWLKEAAVRALLSAPPVQLHIQIDGVRAECRLETDDALITCQIHVTWEEIELARTNLVAQVVDRVRSQVKERIGT